MITVTQECPRQHLDWLHKSCNFIRILYHPLEHAHSFKMTELDVGRFFLIRHHRQIVGCGAIVPYATSVQELRHIFVDAAARGLGCGKALLTHLEESAVHDAVTKIVLETGDKQPEAIGLYAAFGYRFCPAYVANPLPHAIFMEKVV
jgi:putative acetyltransferase